MAEVQISRGLIALVDEADLDLVMQYRWTVLLTCGNKYAFCTKSRRSIYMHRLVMSAPPGVQVDHINRNGLDNRRCNLRFATQSQNNVNRVTRASTGFRGVYKKGDRFYAAIWRNRQRTRLGYFDCPAEAARAYDAAAIAIYGEFAVPNFPAEGAI